MRTVLRSDAEEFEKAEQKLLAPEEVHEKIKKEIRRFKQAVNNPTEAGVSRTILKPCWRCRGISGQKSLRISPCQGDSGGAALWAEGSEGAGAGISVGACADKPERFSNPLSGRPAGDREDVYCQISGRVYEKAVCENFSWRCPGRG